MRRRLTRILAALGAGLTLAAAAACSDEGAREAEAERRDAAYDQLIANQPITIPEYSSDRDNINFWVETWGMEPGTLAYVYLLDSEGEFIGYYILNGLPTAKCKMGTPTWDYQQYKGSDWKVDAPGMSGTYSSGSGECDTYYGKDASTGSYVEFAIGNAMTMLTFAQPYPLPEGVNPPPLGFTEIGEE